jgi:hypothetical protein
MGILVIFVIGAAVAAVVGAAVAIYVLLRDRDHD